MTTPGTPTSTKIAAFAFTGVMLLASTACGPSPTRGPRHVNSNKAAVVNTASEPEADSETESENRSSNLQNLENVIGEYGYHPGIIQTVKHDNGTKPTRDGDFAIYGMIMTGDQHEDDTQILTDGYKVAGLEEDFCLGENISFYFDDTTLECFGNDTSIIALPLADIECYIELGYGELVEKSRESGGFVLHIDPDSVSKQHDRNLVGEASIDEETGNPGKYIFLICKDGEITHYIVVNMSVEI